MNGSQIVAEEWGNRLRIYLYDESGAPMGLQYRNSTYDKYVFDTYYFPTLFVVKTLLGEKIEELGGKGVEIKFV